MEADVRRSWLSRRLLLVYRRMSRSRAVRPLRDTKMTIFVPVAPIVRKLEASAADLKALTNVPAGGRVPAYDYCDYSKVVVRKPWGHEYLIYENGDAAVWILYLAPGRQTSLHCHPGKVTSITVLSGSALCSVLEGAVVRTAGEVMSIGKGVFHRTRSTSDGGTFVMEIESPRSEEHTSELQSPVHIVCRLLRE